MLWMLVNLKRSVLVWIRSVIRTSVSTQYEWNKSCLHINVLNPTGYVMHHQFNIQQLYALPTLYLCVL